MATISLQGVTKTFPNGHLAVHDVTLGIEDGELLVLVGPSGCGKSTVLRLIAGLETVSEGRVLIGGRDVTDLSAQQRDLAMVFQSYALYPHKSVRGNLAFALEVRKMPAAQIEERVRTAATVLGIESLLDRRPAQLSGGQRQRVALGRAIVRDPNAFLLDEPLSNLDPLLRAGTRAELALLHRRLGATIVYVTHDQEEAMTLATRMAVMNNGARKGGSAATVHALKALPSLQALYQLHRNVATGPADNTAPELIANPDETPDDGHMVSVHVQPDGRYEVVNHRTGARRGFTSKK